MNPLFGPSGNSDSFKTKKYKGTPDVPRYINDMGLDAYEYQCGRGVNISLEKATEFGEIAKNAGVYLSLHAPYYISMSSTEEEKRDNSINYILSSARAVNAMGGTRVIVHTGSCAKISREEALGLALDTMKKAISALDGEGLGNIRICPETMGKINQLGTLDEVLTLCELDERLLPCIDFGHLNARTLGGLKSSEDYENILDQIENRLGSSRAHEFHSHFSKIEFSAGGEKRHLTFEDTTFGPDFEPLMELIYKRSLHPVFICESAGTQAEDAKIMRNYYYEKAGK